MDHSGYGLSQWGKALHVTHYGVTCNVFSHWLSQCPECSSVFNVVGTDSMVQPLPVSWASYQIRKMRVAHATFSPPPRISEPDMHHGTCVTHVPWCMPGSLTSVFFFLKSVARNTIPAFPCMRNPQFCISGKRPMPSRVVLWPDGRSGSPYQQYILSSCLE